METLLTVAPDVRRLGIKAISLVMRGLRIPPGHPDALTAELERREQGVLASISVNLIDDDPHLRSFRDLHKRVGAAAAREVAAPESLLRLLRRRGRLPRINPVVDLYNLVSIETRIALGAHDLREVEGAVELIVLDGSERFTPLGADAQWAVPGEYAYVDDAEVICRLEVKQCEKSKVETSTTDALFLLHGAPSHSWDDVERAADELVASIARHCGGHRAEVSA